MSWILSLIAAAAVASTLVMAIIMVRRHLDRPNAISTGISEYAQAGERLETALRVEATRGREEANSASRALREEVLTQFRGFQETLLRASAAAQSLQRSQFEVFERHLTDGVAAVDRRVEAMASTTLTSLGDSLAATVTRLGGMQSEKLELQAAEIRQLTDRYEQAQRDLRTTLETKLVEIRTDTANSAKDLREEVGKTLQSLGNTLRAATELTSETQKERLDNVAKGIADLTHRSDLLQEKLRDVVEQRLEAIRQETTNKLDKIHETVDERLQGTLEQRLGDSFKLVSERLEQVHQGLGEMQALATNVGDLRRILVNVKVRGSWGEVQLGNLLEQMLTPDQYVQNAQPKPESQHRVNFAVRLPGRGDGDSEVLLPIDATFPNEDYERLVLASESGDKSGAETAARQLEARIRNSAKDIRDKYINPPHTTDFAILFLPTEGLYAEILRRPGVAEQLQRDFRVTVAGPTTLGAMLNALQMGFRTLAIQKRSSEVWVLLEAVKTEFGKYGEMLDKLQKKIHEASNTIDAVAVRRRAVDRKLREVGSLPEERADTVLGLSPANLADMAEEQPTLL